MARHRGLIVSAAVAAALAAEDTTKPKVVDEVSNFVRPEPEKLTQEQIDQRCKNMLNRIHDARETYRMRIMPMTLLDAICDAAERYVAYTHLRNSGELTFEEWFKNSYPTFDDPERQHHDTSLKHKLRAAFSAGVGAAIVNAPDEPR